MLNNFIFPPDDGKLKQNKRSAAKPFNGIVALLFYGIVGNRLVSLSIVEYFASFWKRNEELSGQ